MARSATKTVTCGLRFPAPVKSFASPPQGAVDLVVELPVKAPTSVTLGGPELDTLFVTTRAEPGRMDAGSLFACRVRDTRGIPEPEFLDQTPLGADCETLAPGIGRATPAGASRGRKVLFLLRRRLRQARGENFAPFAAQSVDSATLVNAASLAFPLAFPLARSRAGACRCIRLERPRWSKTTLRDVASPRAHRARPDDYPWCARVPATAPASPARARATRVDDSRVRIESFDSDARRANGPTRRATRRRRRRRLRRDATTAMRPGRATGDAGAERGRRRRAADGERTRTRGGTGRRAPSDTDEGSASENASEVVGAMATRTT